MTRIFTEGAEMNDILFWDAGSGLSVTSINPAPAYSAFCYRQAGMYTSSYKTFSAISECYFRQRLYVTNTTGGIPAFRYGTTTLAYMGIDNSAHPYAWKSGTLLETATETIVYNQWYLFEIHYKIDDTVGRFEVFMDGVQIIDYTGNTKFSSYTVFDNIQYGPDQFLGGSVVIAFDDLAMNDVNGGVDDSWCGDGVVIKITPDGNGTHQNWHGSDGDSTDNYLLVDEYPYDSDTTYVYHDGGESGVQDQYTLSDYSGANKTILRIYPEARMKKTAAAPFTVKLGTLASGGTDAMSPARNLTTNYARVVGSEQKVNPVDSNTWEEADIDALQVVLEVG